MLLGIIRTRAIAYAIGIASVGCTIAVAQEQIATPAPVAVESAEPVAERPVAVPQNVPDKNEDIVTMVMLKHADPEKISSILAAFGVKVVTSNSPNAVILTGPEKAIEVASGAAEMLDVPTPPEQHQNVELIVYFVVASSSEITDFAPIPDSLAPAQNQIESVFGLSHLRLMETALLRARDGGEVQASGFMPSKTDETLATWKVSAQRVKVVANGADKTRISLDEFVVGAEVPMSIPQSSPPPQGGAARPVRVVRQDMGFKSDVDITENQLAVVGKASITQGGNSVFVIVTGRVVAEE